jgi:hypothetical protein
MTDLPASIRVSRRLYDWLIRLYPISFRDQFADELSVTFVAQLLTAHQSRHARGLIAVWLRSLVDVTVTLMAEWSTVVFARLRHARGFALPLLAAILASACIGYINLHNDEVQLPFGILLLSSFLIGAFKPRHAWVWAIVVGLGVPVSSLLSLRIGVYYPCRPGHPYSCEPMTLSASLSTTLLVIPALISAYTGVLLRRVASDS